MKNKKYLIIFILIVILLFVLLLAILNKSEKKVDNVENFNINKEKVFNKLLNRQILVTDEYISIGNNIKELENGYFDIKIKISDLSKIEIYINKLYENELPSDLYDQKYLIDFIKYFNNLVSTPINESEFEEIISNNYLRLRSSEEIQDFITEELIKDNIGITCKSKDNMLLIELRRISEE